MLLFGLPVAAAQEAGPGSTAPEAPPPTLSLVDQLRTGGFVIYFRHASTNFSQTDSDVLNLSNCAAQRNLTDQGRAEAAAIGEAIRALALPIGEILSSEYCRTRETATLAFGRVTPLRELSSIASLDAAERNRRLEALRQMLATAPEPGLNTVLVAHQFNLQDAMGVSLNTEGEAAIYQPAADGSTSLISRLLPRQWAELAP
jgi:phosphohistidine phosphatase SixA